MLVYRGVVYLDEAPMGRSSWAVGVEGKSTYLAFFDGREPVIISPHLASPCFLLFLFFLLLIHSPHYLLPDTDRDRVTS